MKALLGIQIATGMKITYAWLADDLANLHPIQLIHQKSVYMYV